MWRLASSIGLVCLSSVCSAERPTPSYVSSTDGGDRVKDFVFQSRVYVPYGPGKGYGFGMGAAEQGAYDHREKYAYAVSEQGAINVVDFSDAKNPKVVPEFAVDTVGSKMTDIELCVEQGLIIVGFGADDLVSNGAVRVYSTVKRSKNPVAPKLLKEFEVGPLPDMVKPTHDCSMVAVGNEGEGRYGKKLVDPIGSLHIIKGITSENPEITQVFFDFGTDEELIAKGVHLPLSLNAMEYWDEYSEIADEINFQEARNNYSPAMNFEPEYVQWSHDQSKVYVNLQENNALVTVEVPKGNWDSNPPKATRIDSYGLKDWSSSGDTEGIDLIQDGDCKLKKYPGFKSLRSPDGIHVFTVDGEDYILTGNEGDNKEYGKYAEKWKMSDLIDGGVLGLKGGFATKQVLKDNEAQLEAGADEKRRVTVGTAAVDFSNPKAPVLHDIVSIGARGISIFKPTKSGLELIWDSGSDFEKEGYAAAPWAHNAIQDEEYAPIDGPLYKSSNEDFQEILQEMNDPEEDGCTDGGNGKPGACPMAQTVDERSPKDGPSAEIVTAGEACGRMIAVTAPEKNGLAYIYDISKVSKPELLMIKPLSPASKTKNPGVAYADRTLGEVDPEQITFLEKKYSPSGKAGVLFGGAWSGTFSFWEFECCADGDDDMSGLRSGCGNRDEAAPIFA